MDELDRLAEVLQKNSYLAKHFPNTWYKIKQREEQMAELIPSLKQQVEAKIKYNEQRKRK